MTEATINKQYAIQEQERGQQYPALQATDYQPKNTRVEISLGFSEDSASLLDKKAIELLKCRQELISYKEDEVTLYIPTAEVRWVLIGRPGLFLFDKESSEYSNLEKGMKLKGTKKVTASRLYLACVCDGELLLDSNGTPQVFTLNLKSSKTSLIGGSKSKPGDGTIASLNQGLVKHYATKGWLTHLVSISLKAVPEKFTSQSTGEFSIGIMYTLDGSARILRDDQQEVMYKLATTPEIMEVIKNPFVLGVAAPVQPAIEESSEQESFDYDEIPF